MKDELFQELLKSIKEGGAILQKQSGLKKISDVKRPCTASNHNPPSMIVLSPGVYEYTCPNCGLTQKFGVRGAWM